MKTFTYSKAVQNEINSINEQQPTTKQVNKRVNTELIYALLTLGAIIATVYVLHINGLIREF